MKGIKNKDGSKTVTFNNYPCTDKITQILYTIKSFLPLNKVERQINFTFKKYHRSQIINAALINTLKNIKYKYKHLME